MMSIYSVCARLQHIEYTIGMEATVSNWYVKIVIGLLWWFLSIRTSWSKYGKPNQRTKWQAQSPKEIWVLKFIFHGLCIRFQLYLLGPEHIISFGQTGRTPGLGRKLFCHGWWPKQRPKGNWTRAPWGNLLNVKSSIQIYKTQIETSINTNTFGRGMKSYLQKLWKHPWKRHTQYGKMFLSVL